MLAQNQMLRRHALGSFPALLRSVTSDSAMLLFLSLADSDKEAPNENYARELMELFTLGRGYTERDIRQAARALTGFRVDWDENGPPRCYYEKEAHDAGVKRIFGHHGHYDWQDVLRLCVGPPRARAVPRRQALGLLRGHADPRRNAPPAGRASTAAPATGSSRWWPRSSPTPRSTGSSTPREWSSRPWCIVAGALRSTGQGIDRESWSWLLEGMGQYPFHPPSVAGWDWGMAWLSSNSMRVRFDVANYLLDTPRLRVKEGSTPERLSPRSGRRARAPRRRRPVDLRRAPTPSSLRMARRLLTERKLKDGDWRQDKQERADMCQRVLRQLLLSGPDAHVH